MRTTITALVLAAALALVGPALAAPLPPTESYPSLLHQIDAHQVVVAYINESTHHVTVTLRNGLRQRVDYPHSDHKFLVDSLLHHGVKPKYTKPTTVHKAVHHVLRYIAAGVVVVLLLIGGGVWAYTRTSRPGPDAHPQAD